MEKPRATVRPTDMSLFPERMKALEHWGNWRYEFVDDKWTKVPCCSRGGVGKSNDPHTWSRHDRAVNAYRRGGYDGLAFFLSLATRIVGGDLDHCGDARAGHIEPWAAGIVERANTYTEWTPSGTGLRFFALGTLPPGRRKKGDVELYDELRYLTVTGRHLAGTPLLLEERTVELAGIHAEYVADPPRERRTVTPGRSFLSDFEVVERAAKAANGVRFGRLYAGDWGDYGSPSEAELALCGLLAFWCGGDAGQIDRLFKQSGLYRPKWEQRHRGDGATYGQMTIERACNRGEFYDPDRLINTAPRRRST